MPALSGICRSFPGSLGTMTPYDPQPNTYNQAPGAFAPYLPLRTSKAVTSREMDQLSLRTGTAFILSPHCAPIWDKVRQAHRQHSPLSTAEGSGTFEEVHTQANLEGRSRSCWVCAQGGSSGAWAWPSDLRLVLPILLLPNSRQNTHAHTHACM